MIKYYEKVCRPTFVYPNSTATYLLWIVTFEIESLSSLFSARKRKLMIVERYYSNRTGKHCDVRFDWGEMCPKLYTELGGRCDLINRAFYCPDIRHQTKTTSRQAQLVMTRMLRVFRLLAQKHNLTYWLGHGTLLGAARHKGFIPWDDDVDIFMPSEDYITFFQSVAKELPEDIFFQNVVSDPALQPRDEEVKTFGLHQHKIVGIYERVWNPRLRDRNSCYRYCKAFNCRWHDGLMVDIFVNPSVSWSVYPLKLMEFEGFLFFVPSNWKKELAGMFGEKWFEFPTDKRPGGTWIHFTVAKNLKDESETICIWTKMSGP